MRKAKVYINDIFAGVFTEDHDGYHFVYDAGYRGLENAKPLSPAMPLQEEELKSNYKALVAERRKRITE